MRSSMEMISNLDDKQLEFIIASNPMYKNIPNMNPQMLRQLVKTMSNSGDKELEALNSLNQVLCFFY